MLEFSPGQRVFWSDNSDCVLEDDFVDPHMIAQDATHEMRRSEALRMAAAHGCVVAGRPTSDVDSIQQSTTEASGYWWLEKPSSYTDGRMERKDGVDLAYAS